MNRIVVTNCIHCHPLLTLTAHILRVRAKWFPCATAPDTLLTPPCQLHSVSAMFTVSSGCCIGVHHWDTQLRPRTAQASCAPACMQPRRRIFFFFNISARGWTPSLQPPKHLTRRSRHRKGSKLRSYLQIVASESTGKSIKTTDLNISMFNIESTN